MRQHDFINNWQPDSLVVQQNGAGIVSGNTQTPFVNILPTADDFEIAAARAASEIITTAIHRRGRCLIALSGGRTPCGIYRRLGDLLVAQAADMSQVYLIFVDERMVPPDNPDSNYGMILREFISRVPMLSSHIFRIKGEAKADSAARDYEQELQSVFSLFDGRCDLITLGVGADGHTASLFPGTEVLHEKSRKVRALFVPRLEAWRVTLTLPVINSARNILFLATGAQKSAIIGKILSCARPYEDLPAGLVCPDSGTLLWMLDAKAASRIPAGRAFESGVIIS